MGVAQIMVAEEMDSEYEDTESRD